MRVSDPKLAPEFLIIAQPLKQLMKIRKMPLVDKFPGNQNNFSDKPYLKQPINGGRFSKGTVYVPTQKRVHKVLLYNYND